MNKLTASDKKKITLDWKSQFVEFSAYKPMWLMRRMGLLLQGILLDKDSSDTNYLPTAHLFNLARANVDTITLALPIELRNKKNAVNRIGIIRHESDLDSIVKDFISQVPLPMTGLLRYEQVIGAYNSYLRSGKAQIKYPYHEWYDMGCLMIWCDQIKEAKKLVAMYEKEMRSWPDSLMEFQGDRVRQRIAWLKQWVESRNDLLDVVNKNVNLLKLETILDIGLVCPQQT